MAAPEVVGKIKVSRGYRKLNVPELGSFAKGITFTGDSDATDPTFDDAALKTSSDKMITTHISRQTNPSTNLTNLEKQFRNTLTDELDADANYVENVANAVAKSAGDRNAGLAVVKRLGFLVAGKGSAKRIIGVVGVGVGWFHAHEAKSKKGFEIHIWNIGITTAKGTAPTETQGAVTCEADCIFNNLPSGSVLAYRHASVVPVSHVAKTSTQATPQSSLAKTSSLIPMSKSKHPVIDFNNKNVYQFGEWRYVVIP
jgi:hypothetical protein